jgi:diphthamide synthase (EF-2-diphthine--ammonia ligase)
MHELLQVLQNKASLDLLEEVVRLRAESKELKDEVEDLRLEIELLEKDREEDSIRYHTISMETAKILSKPRQSTVMYGELKTKFEQKDAENQSLREIIGDLKAKLKL